MYNSQPTPPPFYSAERVADASYESRIMKRVYLKMFLAMIVTAVTSFVCMNVPAVFFTLMNNSGLYFGLLIAEVVLVFVLAGALQAEAQITTAAAMAMALGIAIQNIPEGAIISMPMRAAGNSRLRSFTMGALSGLVEPIGGLLVVLLASVMTPALPYLLAFAAGAMLYVVVEELIPEMSEGEHSNIGTIGFAIGFTLMMVLDVVLG